MLKLTQVLITLFFIPNLVMAQTGTLKGTVIDKQTNETLIAASILILNTQTGTTTDFDGNFEMKLTPGVYSIECSYVSYKSEMISDIEIKENSVINLPISLTSDAVSLEELTITSRQTKNTENSLLMLQKRKSSVINAISAQEISRNGDSQAAGALKRVSGISVSNGKYVYVRGLSDRYSLTTLNNAEIPSLDPNKNSVEMDLFPSSIINNIVVHKTFSAELPASFTGGYINIQTKDYPETFQFKWTSGISYNNNSNFRDDFLSFESGRYGNFTLVDSKNNWATSSNAIPYLYHNNKELDKITRSFDKNMDLETKKSYINHSHSVYLGNLYEFGSKKFGYNISAKYQKSYNTYDNGILNRYKLTGAGEQILNEERALDYNTGIENVFINSYLSLFYQFSKKHKIGLVAMHNRNGNKSANYLEGIRPADEIGLYQQTREMEYDIRAISSAQLKGKHDLDIFNNATVNWTSTFSNAKQNSPDSRYLTNSYYLNGNDTIFEIEKSRYALPSRFKRNMTENVLDNKIDFKIPLSNKDDQFVKFGFANSYKRRQYTEERIDINSQTNLYNGSISDYFNDHNIGELENGSYGIYLQNASSLRNNYNGTQNVFASYAQVDYNLSSKFRFQIGARMEMTDIVIETFDSEISKAELNTLDILPTLNFTYKIQDDMNLRFAASRTLARPTFREFGPYATNNFATGETRIGNKDLKRTLINNLDLRWETFLSSGEIVSVSGFYKHFMNPIETTFNPIASNPELSWKNVANSELYGLEFEFRKKLNFIPLLKDFKFGVNLTLVKSNVKIDSLELQSIRSTDPNHSGERVMFGQSPFILNGFINYANNKLGLDVNLSYNVSAPKLVVVIASGTPNIYKQSFHSLNLNVSKKLSERFACKFSVRNILNESHRNTYKYNNREYIYNKYDIGQTYAVSVSYSISK